MLNSDTILKRRPELLATGMGHDVVMLDMDSGHYFGLSGVGPHIWNQLEQAASVQDVVDSVNASFSVSAGDSVDRDVSHFLQALVDKGLVAVVD